MGRVTDAGTVRRFTEARLRRVPGVAGVPPDEQAAYADVAAAAVEDAWPFMEQVVDDPFLSPRDNQEMARRVPWLAMEVHTSGGGGRRR